MISIRRLSGLASTKLAVVIIIIFAIAGTSYLLASHAATPYFAVEPENGSLTSGASLLNDSTASSGKAILFGAPAAASACPAPAFAAQMPQPTPIVSVKDYGATGNGTTDDSAAITAAVTVIKNAGHGTLVFPAGTYRVAKQAEAAIYFDGISNVTISFDPNATLLMDNLQANGSGGGHGVEFIHHASNIWLSNVHVAWKTLPSSRSFGDGIHFDGYPSDAATISNVVLINPTVEKAPQAGIIFMGVSDVYVKNATVNNTLADGLHTNASRRVSIDTYHATNVGDDALPFVTYYDPSSVYLYPGTNQGPYAQPSLGDWSDTNSCATNITVNGSSANGSRINGGNNIHVSNLTASKVNFGVMIDATEANGSSLVWSDQASQGIVFNNVNVSASSRAFTAIHQGGNDFNSDPRFWSFGVQINNVTANNNTDVWGAGSLEHVQGVTVNGVTGQDRDEVNITDSRNSVINK